MPNDSAKYDLFLRLLGQGDLTKAMSLAINRSDENELDRLLDIVATSLSKSEDLKIEGTAQSLTKVIVDKATP